MIEQDPKKQPDTQFICKLCEMIQKFPHIINWTQDGTKMIIFDIQQMEKLVLPQYFRHSNFSSFVRQLNMYDFHKLQKNQNQIIFKHDIFVKGNDKNFHFIQRKKRIKQGFLQIVEFEKKSQKMLERLKIQTKIEEQTKDVIYSLLEFKYIAYENTKKIRRQLEKVVEQLKDCRSKKLTEALNVIKTEQLKLAKEMDAMMDKKFLVEKQKEKEKQNKESICNMENFVCPQFPLPILSSDKLGSKDLFLDSNHIRSRSSFMAIPSHCGFWSLNEISNLQPLFLSASKVISEVNFGEKALEKQQKFDSQQQDDSLSMDRIGQDELKQILNGQEDKIVTTQTLQKESLKCESSLA